MMPCDISEEEVRLILKKYIKSGYKGEKASQRMIENLIKDLMERIYS